MKSQDAINFSLMHCQRLRASHVGCNACNARIQRILHRICYSNVAHSKRGSSVYIRIAFAQHSHNIRTISAWHSRVITAFDTRFVTRLLRVCRPFIYCRCPALLARRKCAGPCVTFGQYCILQITQVHFSPLRFPVTSFSFGGKRLQITTTTFCSQTPNVLHVYIIYFHSTDWRLQNNTLIANTAYSWTTHVTNTFQMSGASRCWSTRSSVM
jgi:hypothetical protein